MSRSNDRATASKGRGIAERLRAMNKRPADVLRDHLTAFRDDLMRDGQSEAARGLTRLLREFDFVTRRLQSRRA